MAQDFVTRRPLCPRNFRWVQTGEWVRLEAALTICDWTVSGSGREDLGVFQLI